MDKRIPLFKRLEIETYSLCNRKCPGCLRNSSPPTAVRSWHEHHLLSTPVINSVLEQTSVLGCKEVCLSHYNEPFLDVRLVNFVCKAKNLGFNYVFACTNADLITEDQIQEIDGEFDELIVSLYEDTLAQKKQDRLTQLFKKTRLSFSRGFIPTHFSPLYPIVTIANQNNKLPCYHPQQRLIIAHTGDMMLCCEDIPGHFDLGNVHNTSIEDLWYSEKHQQIIESLRYKDGRMKYSHCHSCPRGIFD